MKDHGNTHNCIFPRRAEISSRRKDPREHPIPDHRSSVPSGLNEDPEGAFCIQSELVEASERLPSSPAVGSCLARKFTEAKTRAGVRPLVPLLVQAGFAVTTVVDSERRQYGAWEAEELSVGLGIELPTSREMKMKCVELTRYFARKTMFMKYSGFTRCRWIRHDGRASV